MAGRLWTSATTLVAAAALGVGLVGPAAAAPAPDPVHAAAPLSATQVVAAMQPGWNLGNSLDAVGADETAWGNPRITPALFQTLRAQGFRSVRIPVTWGQHQGPAPDYAVDPAFMDRVQQVVGEALDAGLYVLLDVHHDSWMWVNQAPTQHDQVVAQLTSLWQQIAVQFRDAPRRLLLESLNEPQFTVSDDASYPILDELNTDFVNTVRATGRGNADRVLVLPMLHTDSGQARLDPLVASIDALGDPNIAATFHYYGYWPFSTNIAGGYRYDATAQADTAGAFARVHDTLVAHGIPVILGEYGLLGFDKGPNDVERGEMLKFFENVGDLARADGITTMLWDNGGHLDRTTLRWKDPELFAQASTSWTTSSGTGSTDQVFVRPGAATAQTVTLDPNGNTVTGVWFAGKRLHGGDYTLDGTRLTLSAAFLARVTADGAEGSHGWVEVRFSRGLPWKVEVVASTTPALAAASGTPDGLTIPTAFHGDRLATMEAAYPDGSGAGPNSWTTYKEYDATFTPDAAAGTIALKAAFFAEVADGTPVTLTFHFWSGETVRYVVVKSGATVTGTPA
ncbi:MAG: cellulase family glycosylhydrolase [Promicromonosporaceae bacterium]|nr:cellulase family glycosylhydrolase [Promicromonosporaceae bacterium]